MTADSLKLYQPTDVPTDDTSAAGGASTTTEIVSGTLETYWPNFPGLASGTLDTDAVTKYASGYWQNTDSTSTASNLLLCCEALIQDIATPGVVTFSPMSASDTGYSQRVYGVAQGATAVSSELVALTGLTPASGIIPWAQILRTKGESTTTGTTGQPVAAFGPIPYSVMGQDLATVPQGKVYTTKELLFAWAAAKGDVGTWTNRTVDPGGGSLTYARPNTLAAALTPGSGATLAPGEKWCLYVKVSYQPGMDPISDGLDIELDLQFDGS